MGGYAVYSLYHHYLTKIKITVPLLNDDPASVDTRLRTDLSAEGSLLPSSRFTPRSLLGAGSGEREMMGHLYASQIASAITAKTPDESRVLLVGLGLPKIEMDRETFLQVMELVFQCI